MNIRSFEESLNGRKNSAKAAVNPPGPKSSYVKYIERTASLARKNKLIEELLPGDPQPLQKGKKL